jgi:hypothetical protein
MAIALRYIAAPVLAASVAVTIAAATASAMAESQPARTVDASTTSPDHGGAYCGQFCGTYDAYSNDPDEVAAPAFYGVNTSRFDPLAPVSLRLPIIDADGVPVLQH